ncbi:uncharacterized protein RCO7_04104 [Rhynchosporium graminicola]|uniref:Uncharacterized protein n=1 Tax=Rhynchosporium graminicola TaxID=2792576 RepID=A0A1E1LFM9_9HELO|nr:uncharacterized protein RCO7_04104 [Rhynchosporium commune]
MFGNYALTALAALTSGVLANTPIDNSVFVNDPLSAVKAAAPLWHFDAMTCFPTAATQADGKQPSTPFPTYYSIRKCDKDSSWRVVYDVFFQKDTGHPYDWGSTYETAFGSSKMGTVHTYILGQNPKHLRLTDRAQNGNTNRNHPKAYFGKWKHHVDVHFNDKFENDCFGAVLNSTDYHSDDYAYYASDNLVLGSAVPATYKYGKADSTPSSFEAGGAYDLCGSKFA